MSIEIEDENIYMKYMVSKHTGVPLDHIIVVTRHLNNSADNNTHVFVDFLLEKFIKNNRIKIYFNHQSEGLQHGFLKNVNIIFNELAKKCKINLEQFNVVSGAVNCPRLIDVYKNTCLENDWHLFPLWTDSYWETHNVPNLLPFEIDFNPKTKRILCFNGIARVHRMASVLEMFKRNIFDKAYVSINPTPFDLTNANFLEMRRMLGDNVLGYPDILEKHKHLFPMKLTLDSDIKNAYIINDSDRKLYKDTVVSLINETMFTSKDPIKFNFRDRLTQPCTFATEKTWKAFQAFHPFIMLTTPHFLKDIRHLGYRTFSPYIDESYDDIEDDALRFKRVMDEVERIANMTDKQVYDFQQNVKKILEFNSKMMRTKKPEFVRAL
jgi:hypothetical protein